MRAKRIQDTANNTIHSVKALTLLEILASAAIFGMVMVALIQLFSLGLRTFEEVERRTDEHEKSARAVSMMAAVLQRREPWLYGWFYSENFDYETIVEGSWLAENGEGGAIDRPALDNISDWRALLRIDDPDMLGPEAGSGLDIGRNISPNWHLYRFGKDEMIRLWDAPQDDPPITWLEIIEEAGIQRWREWKPGLRDFDWYEFGLISRDGFLFYFPAEANRVDQDNYGAVSFYYVPPDDDFSYDHVHDEEAGRLMYFLSLPGRRNAEPEAVATDIVNFELNYYHCYHGVFPEGVGVTGMGSSEELLFFAPDAIRAVEINLTTVTGRTVRRLIRLSARDM